jgi:hypothetical protein
VRWIAIAVAALLALVVAFAGTMYVAMESGEVVAVRATDAQGVAHETRLWVVDADGFAWLRTGNPDSAWLARVRANPEIEVARGGEPRRFRAVLTTEPGVRDRINALVLEKYGWAERLLRAVMLRPERATAVRLEPR